MIFSNTFYIFGHFLFFIKLPSGLLPLIMRRRRQKLGCKQAQDAWNHSEPTGSKHVKNTMQRSAWNVHMHFAANTINHCQLMYYSFTSVHRTYHQHIVKKHQYWVSPDSNIFPSTLPCQLRTLQNGQRLSDLHNLSHPALTDGTFVRLLWVPEHRGNGALISQPDIKVIYSHCFAV